MKSTRATGPVAALAALSLALSGCNSGKAPSKEALVAKLKSDSQLAVVRAQGDDAKFSDFVSCAASYLLKKGKKSDLNDYVKGTKKLDDVKGFDSEANAGTQWQKCANEAYGL